MSSKLLPDNTELQGTDTTTRHITIQNHSIYEHNGRKDTVSSRQQQGHCGTMEASDNISAWAITIEETVGRDAGSGTKLTG